MTEDCKEKCLKELGININTKRTRRYYDAGLLNKIDKDFIEEVQNYWQKHYNKKIDPGIHLAFLNLTGTKEKRLIAGEEMTNEIIPYFNDRKMTRAYRDKNIYDIFIKTPNSVKSVLRRIRGQYYDNQYNSIDKNAAVSILYEGKEFIIKPSDSNNGFGINKLEIKNKEIYLGNKKVTFDDIEKSYGYNFIVQDVIQQHPIMAKPHPNSVNTLRMVTLRWKSEIHYLLTFARFGANNSVMDNAGAGGVCVGVTDTGEFLDTAIDENCNTYTSHPTTNFNFSNMEKIPNFENFIKYVKELHKEILHHDFVSWDIAVGIDENPVFIEANFAGATWLYQMACQKPIFGELTEEILQHISLESKKDVSRDIINRKVISITEKLKNNNKNLKKDLKNKDKEIATLKNKITKLEEELKSKEKELTKLNGEIQKIKNNRLWKLTAIFRKK